MYAEAGCVTALAKESDVLVQAVEAHAVLFVSHEFNLHCSQPIESTTFHMYSRNPVSYSSFCFVYSQKPVCLNKCYFKYIRTCFFSDIYCSSQKPQKARSFFHPLWCPLKSMGFVLPWASLSTSSLEFRIQSKARGLRTKYSLHSELLY